MAKGGNNERKKAKEISIWWAGRDDIFWRDNSGARATARAKVGKSTSASSGDIVLQDPIGEALLRLTTWELKKGYAALDMMNLLDSRGNKDNILFKTFWNQVCRDSERAAACGWGGIPILVTHRDNKKPLITMPLSLYNSVVEFCGANEIPKIQVRIDGMLTMTLEFTKFLEWCSPEYFKMEWSKRCQIIKTVKQTKSVWTRKK